MASAAAPCVAEFVRGLSGQAIGEALSGAQPVGVQPAFDRRAAQAAHLGLPDAPGRQQARVAGAQDLGRAERLGDPAGDLAGRAPERDQRVAARIEAALGRDPADRLHRLLDRDRDETFRRRLGTLRAHERGELGKARARGGHIQRPVLTRSEHGWEGARIDPTQHEVGVGDRRRAAAPIGRGARIGAGAGRPDAGAQAVETEDRSAAGRDSLDVQHRAAQPDVGDRRRIPPLERAGVAADVGRGAAHVEAEHGPRATRRGRARHADHAAGRAGDNRVAAQEGVRPHQPAGRSHEIQRRAAHGLSQPLCISFNDGRQIRVGDRRLGARDKPRGRRNLMRERNEAEVRLPAQSHRLGARARGSGPRAGRRLRPR